MGYCLKHSQNYNEQMGGFCVYCGAPESLIKTQTSTNMEEIDEKDRDGD